MDQFERACGLVSTYDEEFIAVRCVLEGHPLIKASRISKDGSMSVDILDAEMNVAGWRRYGESIKKSNKIEGLSFTLIASSLQDPNENMMSMEINRQRALCLQSFFEEMKENKSIRSFMIFSCRIDVEISMPDLLYFLQNNPNLRQVHLRGRMISSTDIESFQQITLACQKMEKLSLYGLDEIHHFTCLAELLRDPATSLQMLDFDARCMHREQNRLVESLTQNTHLQSFRMNSLSRNADDRAAECFETLLCNTATIESVCQSNHSLQTIEIRNLGTTNMELEEHCQQYLELNENPNKMKVAQAKLLQFYFSGDFDTSSLANMNLAVLAQILGMDVQKKQSAMFNILKNIPELCAVSSRGEVQVD